MRDKEADFRSQGASLAAVGLGDPQYARAFRDETGIRFPLLIDEKKQAYRAAGLRKGSLLHILRPFNTAARKRARETGHQQHRLGKDPFQLGGSFVFGPGNVDLLAHISETFGDNAAVSDLLAAVRKARLS